MMGNGIRSGGMEGGGVVFIYDTACAYCYLHCDALCSVVLCSGSLVKELQMECLNSSCMLLHMIVIVVT